MKRRLAGFLLPGALLTTLAGATTLARQPVDLYGGRPAISVDSERGYFLWRDGDTWHVRWMSTDQPRRFTGTIRSLGGRLDNLKRIEPDRPALAAERTADQIERVDDHLIRWTTRTLGDLDGFDFNVRNVDRLEFDLKVDGFSRPLDVEIGRDNAHPDQNPFSVSVR